MTTALPEHVPPDLVREFNHHHDPAVAVDPFTAFDRFRDDRIFWTGEFGGFWVLTRYADIRGVLRDPVTFSSRDTSIPPAGWPRPLMPVELDPPRHLKYRLLLARFLSGSVATEIARKVEVDCTRLVPKLAPLGECDLVSDFARPMQDALFAGLFDVPAEDTAACVRWAADLLQDAEPARRAGAVTEFMGYVGRRIDDCTARPANGARVNLLGTLARAEIDGAPLSRQDALDLAFLMGMAVLDTLTNSISFSFRYLAGHPKDQRRLAEDGAVCDRAAEELLRLHSVVTVARTATTDTTVAGVEIRAGDRILLSLNLADRDADHYPDPDNADFDRSNSGGHLAFGAGPHRCLGARLATKALAASLREWHRHITDYSVPRHVVLHTDGGAVSSLDALPLRWPR